MITVAQGIIKALENENVEAVFGYPGAAVCPLYECLSQSAIRHVLVRQEQNAAHAASGYARISGKPGVVMVTSGPGATNLITGLATAYMDSIPIVAFTGQVSTDQIGKDVFQEADITGAAEPFTKYSTLLKDPAKAARAVREAFYIAASGRPGPVLVDLPIDIQQSPIEFHYPDTVSIRGYKPTYAGNPPQVRRVAAAIAQAKRPLICIGGGVLSAGAGAVTAALAEKCGVPMVSTLMGLSAVPSAHPLYFGMLGAFGSAAANFAVRGADLLVIIGARVGDRALASPSILEERTRIVHIDVDPAEIGKNVGAAIPLVGNAKNIVTQLLDCGCAPDCGPWRELLVKRRMEEEHSVPPQPPETRRGLDPGAFVRELSAQLAPDAVVAADVGQNQIWTARNLQIRAGRLLTSGGMGTMGYSLPAAIGAKLAAPERQTVAICGDGSFQMQMMELACLCQQGLPIKIVVMNNRSLGMVRELQTQKYGARYIATSLSGGPDFLRLAGAYGIEGERITENAQAKGAVARLLGSDTARLLECVVDPDEKTL